MGGSGKRWLQQGDFMKKLVLVFLAFGSSMALAEKVLYCGGLNVEGAYLKVMPAQKKMCISAGPWSEDYCARASENFKIVESRTGSVKMAGTDFTFREYIGKSKDKVQLVRVYNEASNPSGGDMVIHRADFAGPYNSVNVGLPTAEANDGDPTCLEGSDDSF